MSKAKYRCCSKCNKRNPYDAEHYARQSASPTGLSLDCRNCRREVGRRYYQDVYKAKSHLQPLRRRCKCCKTLKRVDAKYFPSEGNGRFNGVCWECSAANVEVPAPVALHPEPWHSEQQRLYQERGW